MDADIDLLLLAAYCIADDFLPKPAANARRRLTDAGILTLCLAQAIMGITPDHRLIAVAGKRLRRPFPVIPTRDAFHKRRLRLSDQLEAPLGHLARQSPGFFDEVALVYSTPVECARARETVKRGCAQSSTRTSQPQSCLLRRVNPWHYSSSVEMMAEPTFSGRPPDPRGEQVRRQRLRADGERPLAVNLRETILLTRKLFELREAARRAS